MSATGHNFPSALSQYEAALAAYQAAYGELHAAHLAAVGCGREGLNAETRAALGLVTAVTGLDHQILDGKLTLLAATVSCVNADDVQAAIDRLHARLKSVATAKAALAAARAQLDKVLGDAEKGAETTCHELKALHAQLTAPKK